MKNILLSLLFVLSFTILSGQVSKTINLTNAGTLSAGLTSEELNSVTNLTITGNIDARDFKTMRDLMPVLAEIDISGATVLEYTGTEGTSGSELLSYAASTIPGKAFIHPTSWIPKLSLTKFTASNSITKIDYGVFQSCTNLAEVTFPAVKNISARVFTDCTALKSIHIPVVESIDWGAFQGCISLTSIQLPQTLTFIGSFAFCYTNINFSVDNNNAYYSSQDGILFNKDKTTLIQFPPTKAGIYIIPSSVQTLEYLSFGNCTKLTDITIPKSVNNFFNNVFDNCNGLRSIKVEWSEPLDFNYAIDVFNGVDKATCTLYVPAGTKTAYQAANQWKDFQNIVEMEGTSGSKTVNLNTAGMLSTILSPSELASITNLTITGNIDARDFKTMRDLMPLLAEIDLSGTTIVGYEGLEGTSKSGKTVYPSNTVPENAFESKPTLKNIILPIKIIEISQQAFLYCRQLLSATLPSSLLKINDQAFGWCNSLSSILLPESLTYIGYNAFATTNLTEINIPQAVGYIGDVVFFQCRKLLSINVSALNEKYSSVDGILFNKDQTILIAYPGGKTALDYTFPSSVKKIAVRSFEGSKLSKINLPDGILDVGFEAFTNMYGLKEISIPSSISKIEAGAFAYNANVVSISVDRVIPLAFGGSYGVFDGINKSSCRLYVPFGSKASYQAADQWKDFQNIIEMEGTGTSKTVNLTTAGTLSTILSPSELASITKLTITGNIDARDFETMRDLMPLLAEIDLSGATILAYNPAGDNLNPANTIPPNAFYNRSTLTGKQSLTTFILPSSATTIGSGAFSNCINLLSITIPSSVTEIMGGAFGFCKKLESVNIPKNVTTIGNQAFYFCSASFIVDAENPNYSSVDGVLFDKSKTTIIQCPTSKAGVYTIPSSVTNLGVNAFSGCSSLSEIIVPPLVKEMGYQTFSNCSGLVKINIPNSVHTIQPYAFEFCRKLSSITIPSSVTQIGGAAFRGCIGLSSIYALKATPVNLSYSSDVFKDVDKATCILYVPSGSENLYATASQWNEFSNIQSIPVVSKTINLTSPGTLASLLTDIELASVNNLTLTGTIDARDFKTMRDLMPALAMIDLSAVTIAEYTGTEGTAGTQLTTYPAHEVPRNAFYNKISLTSMSIPVSATTIGRSAFNNCDGLTQVTFGASPQLKTVGYMSFAYCDAMTEIQIPSGVILIDYAAFRQCSALVTCNLPESVKTIGNAAFYQCTKLKNLSIPQAVETIGEFAFYLCKEVLSFNVPASAVLVGRGTFIGATGTVMVAENNPNYSSLDGVFYDKNKTLLIYCPPSTTGHFTIPATVTTIVVDAFYNCSLITSLDIPEGLVTLEDWAFENCSGIAAFALPASLTSIGNQAFYGCSGLTSIRVNNPVMVDLSAKTDVFSGIDQSTCILYVPAGSKTAYQNAEKWKDFQSVVELTYVPDDNFEQALIGLGYDSGALDNYVLTSNISSVTKLLIYLRSIKDLTGIQDFVSLENLNCSSNNLTSLDVSKNINLLKLECSGNSLTSLDVSKNTELTGLGCAGNLLTALDISKNTNLINLSCSQNILTVLDITSNTNLHSLFCSQNKLTSIDLTKTLELQYFECSDNLLNSIDVSNNSKLIRLICSNNNLFSLNLKNGNNHNMTVYNGLYATGNANLFCIQVDDPALALTYTNWYKDEKASYSSDCEESGKLMTYIPDNNFEQALIDLGYDSGPLNDSVPTFNISGITNLIISNKNISDLTGIEDFSALKSLDCSYNQLINLDFSKNLNLTTLYCNNNKLTSLNLKNGHNSNFFQSYKTSDSRNNPQLFCIQVDDPIVFAGYPGVFKDSYSSYSNDCSAQNLMTFVPDDNFEQALINLGYDSGPLDDYVPTANISSVTTLSLQTKNIADLKGIEGFLKLERLYLSGNKLTSLDVSNNLFLKVLHCQNNLLTSLNVTKNTALTELAPNFNQLTGLDISNNPLLVKVFCQSNQITELNVDKNINLITLICGSNQLTSLNVSNNKALVYLACDNNKIESLDLINNKSLTYVLCSKNKLNNLNIQNGNNANMIGLNKGIDATSNPNLFCIQVDNPVNSSANPQWLKDPQASYSTSCNNIPTANAGTDQSIEEGTTVTLDGSLSSDADQDNLTYKWTAPVGITLSSESAQKPTFVAPEVTQDTRFTFYLVVNDGFTDSPTDQVLVTIKQVNKAPVADAGSDQIIEEGAVVILDGTLSSDADGDSIRYFWTAPDGITLSSSSAKEATLIAPEVTQDTQFTFSLIVNDGFTDSPASQVLITVKNINKVPVANAGVDQIVKTGDKVVLNGTGSFDPDQDPLVYSWTSLNGITLSAASDPSPFFTAPVTKNETDLVFTLTVSDGSAYSKTDTVIISVENKSPLITVKTFFDGTISSTEQVSYELYKETDGKFGKYSATFSIENNTAVFNVEEGNWMVLAIPSVTETNFIPTYFGNSITWNEAEIITVQGEEIVDLEIDCQKVKVETTGEYSIEGFVYQAEGTKSCVVLSNATGNNPVPGTKVLLFRENETTPVRTTFTDNDGKYIFSNLIPAEYNVIVDIPGFDQVDVWNIKLDSVSVSVVNVNFTVIISLGVITEIPETELKTSIYPNPTTGKLNIKTENWPHNSKIEVFNSIGKLIYHSMISSTTFMIDLSNKPDGIYILNISSNKKKETLKIVLRK